MKPSSEDIVTSRILWLLLRQYLGCGLRCLRLRGLLLSARGGTFLSEPWLKVLSTKCPRLTKLYLLHADLRGLPSCQILPPSLLVLELHDCELEEKEKGPGVSLGVGIERLVLNNVPSFTNQHLHSLTSWQRLSQLVLRDTFRVTADGLRSCAAKDGDGGVEGLSRIKFLEIGIIRRQNYESQIASHGLRAGWLGLEELSLGGKEVTPGLLCAGHLKDLKFLCLWACTLGEMQIVRSCRMLRGLRRLEFLDVIFQSRRCPPVVEGEGGAGEEQDNEEAEGGDKGDDENKTPDINDPIPSLRRSLAAHLPSCTLTFSNCSVQISAE
uniref:Uncharacterized protein n=1 Tax=Mola mola TaxID=94237 RepID=A0A3Q3VUF7_MOLML